MPTPSSPARRLRRFTGGAALILFPAMLVVGAHLDPHENDAWSAATHHPAAVTASAIALLLSGMLLVPAACAILHQARDRGAALADVAAAFAVLGGFGHCFIAAYSLISLSLAGGDRAQMTAFDHRVNASATVAAVGMPLVLSFALGAALLAWAAWRSGLIGWWAPVVVTVVALGYDLVLDDPPMPVDVIVQSIPTVIFAYLGVRVLRLSDAEWDGARPATRAPQELGV